MSEPTNSPMRGEMADDTREWWPSDYIDEVVPPGKPSPEAWIKPTDGGFALYSPYWDDPQEEAEREWRDIPLVNGDQCRFMYREIFESVEVTVNRDCTWEAHGPIDERATHFMAYGAPESLEYDMDAFACQYATEFMAEGCDYERIEVRLAYWSDEITYSVKIEGDHASLELAGTA